MGVSTYFYTYFGVRIPFNREFHDAYDEVYDTCELDILVDGMGGEYIIFGKRIFTSGDMRWGFEENDYYKEVSPIELNGIEKVYKEKFLKEFPKFYHLLEDQPFKIMTFMHCE